MGDTRILILPGYGDSGPGHWQSLWQAGDRSSRRVSQRDWHRPVCAEWVAVLEAAVAAAGPDTLLVAHSLGCLLAVHWAAQTRQRIRGALLVAVPDPAGPAFPAQAQGFAPVPQARLPFPTIVVASRDDPYGTPDYASACAAAWGSRLVEIAAAGHINADSGLGAWDQGRALLRGLAGEI